MSASTAVALNSFRQELTRMEPQFAPVLPPHLPVARLARMIATAVQLTPKLLDCSRASLWSACMSAAVLGLEPDPATGQGYLIPFKGKVTFVPGYKGLITLASHSGVIVQGRIVRALDDFDYAYGINPRLDHKPARVPERGAENPIVAAYATARSRAFPAEFVVLEMPELLRTRDRSSGYQYAKSNGRTDNPWQTDFEAMCRKSAIRALAPQMPLTVQKAVALDAAYDRGEIAYARKVDDAVVVDVEHSVVDEPDPHQDQPAPAAAGGDDWTRRNNR